MRSAVLIGTDFAYDSKGKLIPLEINTNVGWDTVNRKETVDEIFDFTDLSMYVRENAIKEILLEGKIAEICKDAIQKAIPHVTVSEATMGDYEEEHPNTTLFIRTAWSSQALVDTFAASKEKFKSLIKNEDFCEGFSEPSGNLPNLVVKAIDPQYDKLTYPRFYKADVSTLKVPHGFIVEPAVLNVDNLVEGRIPVFRNWSLFVAGENGDKIDTIYLGTYTKVCGDEFDESKLKYDSDGALVEGRGMFLSLDGLSTQWPADALVEASDEVLMSDGSWKKASELKVGDKVKSLQFEDSLDIRHHVGQLTTTEKELKKSFAVATVDFLTRTRGYRDFVEIKFDDKSDWFDTANSSYLVKRESGLEFDYISNLKKGDVVYFLKDGSKLATKTVESTDTVRKYVDTYNVGLAENHVFFSRGEGETSAFASLEHNDTEDCRTAPKSANGAFQTFISFDGTDTAKGTLNISTSGVSVTSGSTTKTFAKTSGTASANGEYVNPNDYSSGKGGFTGCWYPLAGNNTWNINVPLTTVDSVKSVATIVRIGSADGNALDGSNTYWKFTEISSTSSNVLWPVTFSPATGPCKLHVQVYQPSDIIQITEPTGKSFEADGTVTSGNTTASISFPQGTGIKGNVSGSIIISKEFLDFDYTGEGITTGSSDSVVTFDTSKVGEIKYSTKARKNDTLNIRYDSVSTVVNTAEGKSYEVGFYTMQQKALEPTLTISPDIVELPASYSAGDYRISVSSNVPWTASLEAASASGYEIVNGSGTGSGEFIIRPVSESVRYSYDGLALRELVRVSTNTGKPEKDLTEYLLVYKNTKLFVKPEITFQKDIYQLTDQADCVGQVMSEKLIQKPFILAGDPNNPGGEFDSYDITDPSYNLADGSGGDFDRLKDLGWRVLGCVPIQVENVIPEMAVTVGVHSEDLLNYIESSSTHYPYGLIYVGSGKDSQVGYGDDIPVLFVDANTTASVNSQLSQTLYLDEDCVPSSSFGLFGQNAKPTPCLLIGTGSVISTTASVELFVRYKDLVTGKSETVRSSYTIGDNATFNVVSDEWSQASQTAAMYPLSASGISSILVHVTYLEPSGNYKFIGSSGLKLTEDGRTDILNTVKTGQEWTTLSDDQYLQLHVLPNETANYRIMSLALVPENNGTVEDLDNETYWQECNESTGYSKNGSYYMYQCVSQEGSSSKISQNSITVQCNPISVGKYGSTSEYYNAMYFGVTASAKYPVSSSVTIELMPSEDRKNNIFYRGPVTISIAKGATQGTYGNVESSNCLMWYGNGISYRKSELTLPAVSVESVIPVTDSFFKYETGPVSVASVLGLGGDKIITGSKSYKLSEGLYTGYTVSSSAEDVCTCTLRRSLALNNEGMYLDLKPGTKVIGGEAQITLSLNGKMIDRCNVTYRNEITPVALLRCSPNNITGDTTAGTTTVTLYTGSGLPLVGRGLIADSVSSSSGWISVDRWISDSDGGLVDGNVSYRVSVTAASASRSGSVKFTKDSNSYTLGVTQSQANKVVDVWFVPIGSTEQQVNGSATINLTTSNRYQLSNSRYMYCFRYENYGQVRFKPVFEPVEGSTVSVSLDLDQITDTEGYTTADSGNFYLTVTKKDLNMSAQNIGTLSFQSSISDAMIPKNTPISSQVH